MCGALCPKVSMGITYLLLLTSEGGLKLQRAALCSDGSEKGNAHKLMGACSSPK